MHFSEKNLEFQGTWMKNPDHRLIIKFELLKSWKFQPKRGALKSFSPIQVGKSQINKSNTN